jgi:hypothetical protein
MMVSIMRTHGARGGGAFNELSMDTHDGPARRGHDRREPVSSSGVCKWLTIASVPESARFLRQQLDTDVY